MIARFTIFAILVLSLATYASTPAGNTAQPQSMCCDGDPIGPAGK